MDQTRNTVIESLGVYLPPQAVSSQEVMQGCVHPIDFPLEDLTGIRWRRKAGEEEFAIDLARRAIEECLANSSYEPQDIDILICSNICRFDGPGYQCSFEPSTAVKLQKQCGFDHALTFDVSSACPGMFAAIKILDVFIKTGAARRGMVVSGEYISHLTATAQREVDGVRDPRLACLTLGDAGAAVLLDAAPSNDIGFHELDLQTMGYYSDLCIAKANQNEHGGAVMLTHPTKLSPVAVRRATAHAVSTLAKRGWPVSWAHHLIPHQVSSKTFFDVTRELNRVLQRDGWTETIIVDNLSERGNTATTSHFVALMDHMLNGRIQTNDNVVFSIAGSGLTIGTALYTLDDLPERVRRPSVAKSPKHGSAQRPKLPVAAAAQRRRATIRGVGTASVGTGMGTIDLATAAARQCLLRSRIENSEIELLIFAGVYRTDFVLEPAIAALIAGALDINARVDVQSDKRTFAFDVFNGGVGFLDACYVASRMIEGGLCRTAMVSTAEVENNWDGCPGGRRGVEESGAAMVLSGDGGEQGFGRFLFRSYTDYIEDLEVHTAHERGRTYLRCHEAADLEEHYLACIRESVRELLDLEAVRLSDVTVICPPQRSSAFVARLGERLGVDPARCIDVCRAGGDLLTSSQPHALQQVLDCGAVKPGDIALMIEAGSGVQVACATYRF